jgi:anti-sigma regulatory factor (Ser/Thr protein kinase)
MIDVIDATLPRDPGASSVARRVLQSRFSSLETSELHTVKLLVSELVNNAVLHGKGKITLRGALSPTKVRVEVVDEGTGFVPDLSKARYEDRRGRGLLIVDAQASRWGICNGTTTVWFELDLPSAD